MATKLPPIHPGEILLEEFLHPMGISQYRLAKSISVPPRRINEVVHGNRALLNLLWVAGRPSAAGASRGWSAAVRDLGGGLWWR